MNTLIIAIVVLAAASAILSGPTPSNKKRRKKNEPSVRDFMAGVREIFGGKKLSGPDVDVYERVGPLMSPAELNFYRLLVKVLAHPTDPGGPPQAVVMSKVRVMDIISVKSKIDPSASRSAKNRIQAKHADFVLCEPGTMRPFCVIELDDKSHRSEKVRRRDALMDSIYAAAGVPIVHVDCRRGYSMQEVGGMIREAIGRGG